jgi:hypothetical protein
MVQSQKSCAFIVIHPEDVRTIGEVCMEVKEAVDHDVSGIADVLEGAVGVNGHNRLVVDCDPVVGWVVAPREAMKQDGIAFIYVPLSGCVGSLHVSGLTCEGDRE